MSEKSLPEESFFTNALANFFTMDDMFSVNNIFVFAVAMIILLGVAIKFNVIKCDSIIEKIPFLGKFMPRKQVKFDEEQDEEEEEEDDNDEEQDQE